MHAGSVFEPFQATVAECGGDDVFVTIGASFETVHEAGRVRVEVRRIDQRLDRERSTAGPKGLDQHHRILADLGDAGCALYPAPFFIDVVGPPVARGAVVGSTGLWLVNAPGVAERIGLRARAAVAVSGATLGHQRSLGV